MKKIIIVFTGLFFAVGSLLSQVLTTLPGVPTANGEVSIRFNISEEPGPLNSYSGKLYAHTGLNFSDGTNWQNVIGTWGDNTTQPEFQYIGFDTYNLTLSPDLYTFYNASSSKEIVQIAIVIRSEDGSLQTDDYTIDIYPEGLNINIISPSSLSTVIELSETIDLEAVTTDSDTIAIYQNDVFVAGTNTNNISHTFTGDTYGENEIVIWAANDTEEIRDTVYYYVRPEPIVESIPPGMTDGINYLSETSVILSIYAPNKDYIFAIGDFSNWLQREKYYMKKTPDGNRWWIQINDLIPTEEYAYQYRVDNELYIGDPYADKLLDPWNDQWISDNTYPNLKPYPEGANGIVSVFETAQESFLWEVENFTAPDKENLVIYELLLRDFITNHDWKTLTDTLDYLSSLGINAIELMPFNEFEGNESWGYNPSYFFAPDKYYGPKEDLKTFIDACHQRDIAVIMDIVLNHAMGQCPLAMLYFDKNAGDWGQPTSENPWFNVVSPNPVFFWGSDFNHESQATKDFVDRVNKYWLTEYKVDGFRFDFTKGFTNTPGDGGAYDGARINILKRMADEIWTSNADAYVILEHFADNSEEIILSDYGMMIWGNTNHNYNQATMGYSSESDFSWGVSYKKRGWSNPNLIGYMESHDEERLMFKNLTYGNSSGDYDVKDLKTALRRMELAGAFFFTIPGPKMIWQFGELGYDYSINDDCRVCNKPIRWDYYSQPDRLRLFKTYSALIDLKLTESAFSTGDYSLIVSGMIKIIALNHADMDVRIIGNFDVQEKSAIVSFSKNGIWYDYFSGSEIEITDLQGQFVLDPGEFIIYTTKKLSLPDISNSIDPNIVVENKAHIYPVPTGDVLNVVTAQRAKQLSIYDTNGRLLRTFSVNNDIMPTINLSGIVPGIYMLKINYYGGGIEHVKFVKTMHASSLR